MRGALCLFCGFRSDTFRRRRRRRRMSFCRAGEGKKYGIHFHVYSCVTYDRREASGRGQARHSSKLQNQRCRECPDGQTDGRTGDGSDLRRPRCRSPVPNPNNLPVALDLPPPCRASVSIRPSAHLRSILSFPSSPQIPRLL